MKQMTFVVANENLKPSSENAVPEMEKKFPPATDAAVTTPGIVGLTWVAPNKI